MKAGEHRRFRGTSSSHWTVAVSAVLVAVFVAIGAIQTRQVKMLDSTVYYNEENISWMFFQLQQEYQTVCDSLRQAERFPHAIDSEALRQRYEIFVSRFSLMQSMRFSPMVQPLPVQASTIVLLEKAISYADAFLSESSTVPLTPGVITQLLREMEPLDSPVHDLTLLVSQVMVNSVSQRNAAARDHVSISIALTVFQGLLILAFAALLIRKVGSLEKRSQELGQATDEILLLNSELEKRVHQRTAQLETANQELKAFSYSVSHDLRSPLKSIDGFSHLLERSLKDKTSEKENHYLNRIRGGVQQMGELIDGLLALAQLSRDTLHIGQVDLAPIASRIVQECRERDPDRQSHVRIQQAILATGDQRQLLVVMQNLLGNAWKFTSKQPLAEIEVGSQAGNAGETVYFIKDNGAGFDMAYAEKLFGTFQRLHSPADFVGTGIGLATVKRVIDRHGGRIWAESKVGEGAMFFFTLGTDVAPDH